MDQGIIQAVKANYKGEMLLRLVDVIENWDELRELADVTARGHKGLSQGCSPNLLDAAEIVEEKWNELKAETIINCYIKSDCLPTKHIDTLKGMSAKWKHRAAGAPDRRRRPPALTQEEEVEESKSEQKVGDETTGVDEAREVLDMMDTDSDEGEDNEEEEEKEDEEDERKEKHAGEIEKEVEEEYMRNLRHVMQSLKSLTLPSSMEDVAQNASQLPTVMRDNILIRGAGEEDLSTEALRNALALYLRMEDDPEVQNEIVEDEISRMDDARALIGAGEDEDEDADDDGDGGSGSGGNSCTVSNMSWEQAKVLFLKLSDFAASRQLPAEQSDLQRCMSSMMRSMRAQGKLKARQPTLHDLLPCSSSNVAANSQLKPMEADTDASSDNDHAVAVVEGSGAGGKGKGKAKAKGGGNGGGKAMGGGRSRNSGGGAAASAAAAPTAASDSTSGSDSDGERKALRAIGIGVGGPHICGAQGGNVLCQYSFMEEAMHKCKECGSFVHNICSQQYGCEGEIWCFEHKHLLSD
jgi:hypothetical protein